MNKQHLSRLGIVLSIVLFLIKLWAGIMSKSIAIISDALNSFLDVFSYSAIHISIMIQEKDPDANHPFGHRRAEPIAGFIIAIFATLLGATIIKDAIVGFFSPQETIISSLAIWVLVFSIVAKTIMTYLYHANWRKTKSAAMQASYVDSRNDIMASLVALIGFTIGGIFDSLAGLIIGIWILYSGILIGLENLGYLMGQAPSEKMLQEIEGQAMKIEGVLGINNIVAHYVGDVVHAEVHVVVSEDLTLKQAHDLGVLVRKKLEELDDLQRAFVHIDPEPKKLRRGN